MPERSWSDEMIGGVEGDVFVVEVFVVLTLVGGLNGTDGDGFFGVFGMCTTTTSRPDEDV